MLIRNIEAAMRKGEQQKATIDGLRFEKKARMRPRHMCCACGKDQELNLMDHVLADIAIV